MKAFDIRSEDWRAGFSVRVGDLIVSTQIGRYTYSDQGKTTAEVAVVYDRPGQGIIDISGPGEIVRPRVTPKQWAEVIALVAAAEQTDEGVKLLEQRLQELWTDGDH